MRRAILVFAAFLFLSAGLAVQTGAEVRVRVGPTGEYDSTVIIPGGPPWSQGIWSTRTRVSLRRGSAVLNSQGDRYGDLMPAVVDYNHTPYHPWAVWSHFNGRDYDLVFSAWRYGWKEIRPVTHSLAGDDLDPSLTFTRAGYPVLAWWNQDLQSGEGSVYYAVFAGARWWQPVKISEDSIGGRHPVIEVVGETITIHYDSDDGSVRLSYQVPSSDPTTITDDIDPQTITIDDSVASPKGIRDRN